MPGSALRSSIHLNQPAPNICQYHIDRYGQLKRVIKRDFCVASQVLSRENTCRHLKLCLAVSLFRGHFRSLEDERIGRWARLLSEVKQIIRDMCSVGDFPCWRAKTVSNIPEVENKPHFLHTTNPKKRSKGASRIGIVDLAPKQIFSGARKENR